MHQVFDPDNLLWSGLSRIVDFIGLSIFWAVMCLPVITIGPATAALYYTVVKCFREGEKAAFTIYFRAFKENFKKGALATLIVLPVAALLAFGYAVMRANWGSDLGAVLFVAYDIAIIIPIGIVCWLFPVIGRFEMSLKDAFKISLTLCISHLPSSVIVALLTIECFSEMINRWWPVFFVPVLWMLLCSLFFERVFFGYMQDEKEQAQ